MASRTVNLSFILVLFFLGFISSTWGIRADDSGNPRHVNLPRDYYNTNSEDSAREIVENVYHIIPVGAQDTGGAVGYDNGLNESSEIEYSRSGLVIKWVTNKARQFADFIFGLWIIGTVQGGDKSSFLDIRVGRAVHVEGYNERQDATTRVGGERDESQGSHNNEVKEGGHAITKCAKCIKYEASNKFRVSGSGSGGKSGDQEGYNDNVEEGGHVTTKCAKCIKDEGNSKSHVSESGVESDRNSPGEESIAKKVVDI